MPPSLTISVSGVESADVADAAHPLVHVLLGVGHQVEDPVDGLDIEDEAVLQVLLVEGEPRVHLLTQVQVDHADGLLGVVILVVLQNVRVPGQSPAPKHKPPLFPCLMEGKGKRDSALLSWYQVCKKLQHLDNFIHKSFINDLQMIFTI